MNVRHYCFQTWVLSVLICCEWPKQWTKQSGLLTDPHITNMQGMVSLKKEGILSNSFCWEGLWLHMDGWHGCVFWSTWELNVVKNSCSDIRIWNVIYQTNWIYTLLVKMLVVFMTFHKNVHWFANLYLIACMLIYSIYSKQLFISFK